MIDNNEIKVSITLLAYKHAKYVRQALDSILCQKVNFRYEIIIADDCSNDGTAEILSEYKEKYPDIIFPIIQEKNLGGMKNASTMWPHIRGKYISEGESDDFWTDENRLQKQVDFLESHPEYVAVGCNHYNVDPNGKNPRKALFRWQVNKKCTLKDFLRYGLVLHGNTILQRNIFPLTDEKYIKLRTTYPTMGDVITRVLLLDRGDIFILPDVMHAHRSGLNDKSSFLATSRKRAIEYSYMYNEIVDTVSLYLDDKYDLSLLKANHTGGMLAQIVVRNFTVNSKDLNNYLKTFSFKMRLMSYERCFQKLFRAFIHKIGEKLKLYY